MGKMVSQVFLLAGTPSRLCVLTDFSLGLKEPGEGCHVPLDVGILRYLTR